MTQWTDPSTLDRMPLERGEADLDGAWRGALVLRVDPEGRIAAADGIPEPLAAPGRRRPSDILLGRARDHVWFARPVDRIVGESIGWRQAAAADQDVLASAVALGRWHGSAPACERCGAATRTHQAGASRRCTHCGELAFARTDPCIIIAITDPDDRLLLAHNVAWEASRVSIVAGFIEAGESAEQACFREAQEEVGITLDSVRYISSQPWPLPRSLMLGFVGRTVDSRITVDGDEIATGAFYTREELVAAVESDEVVLPQRASIARSLIEQWLSGR